ncbi:hypothetical protein [Desertivirga xinjiangensis]|uniref:hypothetical protein n=1 Tax=Desertivirga xinjiangensis TaxID=539206 RepID=UPI0021087F73|nr:hypothetical protein [Pedobacter xinjiangensis]
MKKIKAGFLVSYDYEYLKTSLPIVYPYIEEIFLCLDLKRRTWSGEIFTISDTFWSWLDQLDIEKKIVIYEDDFYIENVPVIELDTRERQMLSARMGDCDWFMQIDSDEYFVDFPELLRKLNNYEPGEPVSINCKVIPMYKQTEDGFIIVSEAADYLPFITNSPVYTYARYSSGLKQVFWDDRVVHQSWARRSAEIKAKLNNWGHKDDFNTESYYNLWDAIDDHNYVYVRNFHPLDQVSWPKLELFKQRSIEDLIELLKQTYHNPVTEPRIDPLSENKPETSKKGSKDNFSTKFWSFRIK